MGGEDVSAGIAILNRAKIPSFGYPDEAARMFQYMWRYTDNLRGLYETPVLPVDIDNGHLSPRTQGEKIIEAVRSSGRTILTEFESKQLLAAYGIPIVETRIAKSEDEAVSHANAIGYPVVLKLFSETITHKTDVGGVQLNIADADDVRRACRAIHKSVSEKAGTQHFQGVTVQPMVRLTDGYELIVGASIDPQFGPVLLFGTGGQLVEVFKDRSLALPPLNTTLARRMIERTTIYKALKGVRGRKPVDLPALEQLMVRFAQLVVEQRWIKEIDINPLLALIRNRLDCAGCARRGVRSERDAGAIAASIDSSIPDAVTLSTWTTPKGLATTFRPIRPEDEPLLIKFHETLSDRSVYLRYLHPMMLNHRVTHERLSRICFVDYDREIALVAESEDATDK